MLRLTGRYASALLEYAKENGLETIYHHALRLVMMGHPKAEDAPEILRNFLEQVPEKELEAVLYRFIDLARQDMDMLPVEIISAVPLRPEQVTNIEAKLIRMYRKQLDINTTVEPSLLGGLRIIVDNTVLDDSIKRKISDMKNVVYKGVYFSE